MLALFTESERERVNAYIQQNDYHYNHMITISYFSTMDFVGFLFNMYIVQCTLINGSPQTIPI